jgi:hypothetical protein
VISEVVAGVLVDAIVATGRRLGANAAALARRRRGGDLGIAQWFDTYQLTADPPGFPDLSPEVSEQLVDLLQTDDVHAVLHELLAARLTDSPDADVVRIRAIFYMTLGVELPELASLASKLFTYYDEQICELVGRLEGTEPAVLAQIRAEAIAARMVAILGAIERHTAALSSSSDRQNEAAFLSRYRRHVIEHHGMIDIPDFQRRRRVPVADLYVTPVISQIAASVSLATPGKIDDPPCIDVWTLAGDVDRTVLLGDPGGGKTTAANVLMHYYASNEKGKIPFLVTLREFAAGDTIQRSVASHLAHKLEVFYQCPAPPGLLSRLLLTGGSVVIFDGLDELLDATRRLEITAIIERFCAEYPLTPILVTSRLVGYDEAQLDDRQFALYRIDGFGDDQVGEYVYKWFTQENLLDAAEAEGSAGAFMEESASVPDLRSNPLMLALMCILYRGEGSLPRSRAEIYGQCANLLFHKWDTRRHIHMELRAGHLLEPTLQHLAWRLFTHDPVQSAMTRRELIEQAANFLRGRGFESALHARQAAEEFIEFCHGRMWVFTDTGTTSAGEALYSFAHRTFLEYFAAAHLAYDCDTPEGLARAIAPHVARHEWEVVGELAVQIKDHTSGQGAQRIYSTLLGERRRRAPAGRGGVLQFLARCLRSVDPPPKIVRLLARDVLDHLYAGDPNDEIRALPLCWLLACCDRQCSAVKDEIGARVTQMTSSDDLQVRLNGVRLAAYLPFGAMRGDGGPGMSPRSAIRNFWWKSAPSLLRANAETVAAAAADDGGIRFAALWWHIITLQEALRMPGGPLTLFQNIQMELAKVDGQNTYPISSGGYTR